MHVRARYVRKGNGRTGKRDASHDRHGRPPSWLASRYVSVRSGRQFLSSDHPTYTLARD
jgi:hypothetical protein